MTCNSTIITLSWEFHASLHCISPSYVKMTDLHWSQVEGRLLSLIEIQQEEVFDAMEFIKFTWNYPGCYIYHTSKVVCAKTFVTGS